MLLRPLTARIVVIQWGNYNETFNNNLKKSWHLNMLWFRWLFLAEALLDSTWERPGQPSNHCYVWSTCELIIEVLKCKVSLLRITNMPLTSWDLRFFRETKSHFLSSMFFFFCNMLLEYSVILDPNLKAFFTHVRNMKNKYMFIYTDDVGVSVLIFELKVN